MSEENLHKLSLLLYELSIDKDVRGDEDFQYRVEEFRDEFKRQMYILKDIDLY